MGLDFTITNNSDTFNAHNGPKLSYHRKPFENAVNIVPHSVLFDYGIKDYHIQVKNDETFGKTFFQNSTGSLPFDLPAAAFWLLTRYEEYLPHKADSEGRFSYRSSLAYQYHFLHYPLVNLWLERFKSILKSAFPDLQFKEHHFSFLGTIDVDNVYKYKYKGFVRTMAGFLSDKSIKERLQRWRIIIGKEHDPFDCYDYLIATHTELEVEALYFFLLGDYGPNDKNHSSTDLRFQRLIKHVNDYSKVGLHPSYGSNAKPKQLRKELVRLGNITHRFISKSRQHFSILHFPQTYRDLLSAGILADYSMGYTNYNGFRASYCFPYRWYSLEIESVSSLMLHPYCVSEVTLQADAEKRKEAMLTLALELISEVKSYGGEMVSIFHNHMFDDEMKKFYPLFLQAAKSKSKIFG